ncbi:Vacuolar protein sorting-associated protein [Lachnellula willkommii]|uniref:Vacuolar protein sorting-associated protein n=1 Tax=Lachnellula willkommii TaxID=215461 RepID=A0A559MEL1_9HELO|nr:Vacuolar protein sorting-associated protein [Lachnellula willkommii]
MGVANVLANGGVMMSSVVLWVSQNMEDEYSYNLALWKALGIFGMGKGRTQMGGDAGFAWDEDMDMEMNMSSSGGMAAFVV